MPNCYYNCCNNIFSQFYARVSSGSTKLEIADDSGNIIEVSLWHDQDDELSTAGKWHEIICVRIFYAELC